FNGATFQATATGESSQLTASCTFTDATIPYIIAPTFTTPGATVTFSTLVQETSSAVGSIRYTVPPIPAGWTILSGSVTATSNNSTWAPGVVGGGGSTITFLATAANAVPQHGWVGLSFTATAPATTGNQSWTVQTWSNNTATGAATDSSNADGEQVASSLNQRYCTRFVQAAATLAAPSVIGATNIKVTNVTGFAPGQTVLIDNESNQETRVIATVGTPGAGGTGITLTAPLTNAHTLGQTVAVPDLTAQPGVPHDYKLIVILTAGPNMQRADIFLPTDWTYVPVATTTLAAAANAGNTNIKVTSVTGLAVGQAIRIDDTNQEMGVITAVGTPGAGGTGVTLANKLNFAHPNGVTVEAFNIKIDANSSFTNWTYSQNAGSSNPDSPIDNEISIYDGTQLQIFGNFIQL